MPLTEQVGSNPCARADDPSWYLVGGHCFEMLPRERMAGVLVTGFEESSFFPNAKAIPDRNDPRRYRLNLDVDLDRIHRMLPVEMDPLRYHAIVLTFFGWRSRYPIGIDCEGERSYKFVADEVETARYFGTIADPDLPERDRPDPPFRRSGEGGVIGLMEEETIARCGGAVESAG